MPRERSYDERWVHGMNGWRVRLATTFSIDGLPLHAEGEITGFAPGDCVVSVAFDGEEEPRRLYWHAVRPA
jgi:hypothetical protein